MKPSVQPVVAYLATLASIVVLSITAAIVCIAVEPDTHLAQIVAALSFISAAVTGLIGVIGTFRPKATGPSEVSAAPPGEGE